MTTIAICNTKDKGLAMIADRQGTTNAGRKYAVNKIFKGGDFTFGYAGDDLAIRFALDELDFSTLSVTSLKDAQALFKLISKAGLSEDSTDEGYSGYILIYYKDKKGEDRVAYLYKEDGYPIHLVQCDIKEGLVKAIGEGCDALTGMARFYEGYSNKRDLATYKLMFSILEDMSAFTGMGNDTIILNKKPQA